MKKLIVAAIVPKASLLAKFNRFPHCEDGLTIKLIFISSIKELISRDGEEVTH